MDTADHVAVFTPGFTSNLPDSLSNYDGQVESLRRTSLDQLARTGSTDTVAAVTWIGYDAPQVSDGAAVLTPDPAIRGGSDLAGTLDGIDASRVDDPHLTAIGHSYGSTTTGYALQQATGVDDAALFGSPGSSGDDISDFNLPPDRLAVIEADDDPVTDAGIFGTDPGRLDGASGLSALEARHPDGSTLHQSFGHSEYLTPGTTSQYNLAATVAGLHDERIEGDADQFHPGDAVGPFILPR